MGNLPEQPSNVTRRATKNNWLKRQIEGKRGLLLNTTTALSQ
ncbi:hypothetical protein [Mannheimia haemolytica]